MKNNSNMNKIFFPNYNNTAYEAIGKVFTRLDLNVPLKLGENTNQKINKFVENSSPEKITNLFIIIADSMGYQNLIETNAFEKQREKNDVLILDSVFPTVTPTIMSSLTHILPPSKHELVGYCIYHPKIRNIINTINLRAEVNGEIVHIEKLGLSKSDILRGIPISKRIKENLNEGKQKGDFIVYIPTELDSDGIGIYLYSKNKTVTYDSKNPFEILFKVNEYKKRMDQGEIIIHSIYLPHPDHASHYFGNNSKEYKNSVKLVEDLAIKIKQIFPESLILVTSDHGQVNLPKPNSKNRPKLSKKEIFNLKRQGVILGFSGRTIHFYYDKEKSHSVNAVDNFFEKYRLNEENAYFIEINNQYKEIIGHSPSRNALEKLGNMVVIFSENFYLDHPATAETPHDNLLIAQHGGLTLRELKVPFILL